MFLTEYYSKLYKKRKFEKLIGAYNIRFVLNTDSSLLYNDLFLLRLMNSALLRISTIKASCVTGLVHWQVLFAQEEVF
jgi:hypothetical protein